MEKKLRKKFVKFTTGISVVTLMLIVLLTNCFNYARVMSNSNAVLDMLIENNLQLQPEIPVPGRLPQEVAYTTRFFVVRVDDSGEVHFVDTKNISSVMDFEAREYTVEAMAEALERGTVEDFYYAKLEGDGHTTYVFVDREEEFDNFYSFCTYSVVISLSASIIIFILANIFSKTVLAPIIDSYDKQKRFITDVSHEFKTPLAIMKANNDVIELDYGKSQWTGSIRTQINRLSGMISDLITLTKMDEEGAEIFRTDFSLSDALEEVVEEFSATIKNEGLSITTNIGKNITYCGDELSLRKLFSLLVENAIKYASPGSEMKVELQTRGSKTYLSVQNQCEGVPLGRQDQWFERFYREELSRNGEKKGYGIGLSIAKAICEQHKAKISAESPDGEKVVISVVF